MTLYFRCETIASATGVTQVLYALTNCIEFKALIEQLLNEAPHSTMNIASKATRYIREWTWGKYPWRLLETQSYKDLVCCTDGGPVVSNVHERMAPAFALSALDHDGTCAAVPSISGPSLL